MFISCSTHTGFFSSACFYGIKISFAMAFQNIDFGVLKPLCNQVAVCLGSSIWKIHLHQSFNFLADVLITSLRCFTTVARWSVLRCCYLQTQVAIGRASGMKQLTNLSCKFVCCGNPNKRNGETAMKWFSAGFLTLIIFVELPEIFVVTWCYIKKFFLMMQFNFCKVHYFAWCHIPKTWCCHHDFTVWMMLAFLFFLQNTTMVMMAQRFNFSLIKPRV